MTKQEARTHYKNLRKGLSEEDVFQKSHQICQRLVQSFPIHSYTHLHTFLPISKQQEVDTWQIIRLLKKDFWATKILVSKSNDDGTLLHTYLNETQLSENRWGILEPKKSENIPAELIDIVLVPLLAFDKMGHRVGYGKGYYDRFLASCRTNTLKVGLSFFEPIETIIDLNETDIKLDFCLTPQKIWTF